MTTISNYKVKIKPQDIAEAMKSYQAASDAPVTGGMEMEKFILKADGQLPDSDLHNAFYASASKRLGDKTSVEPGAHMIEIKTGVHKCPKTLTKEMFDNLTSLKEIAEKHNIKVSDTSDIPHVDINEIKTNLISEIDPITNQVRRTPAIIKAYEDQGFAAMAYYGMNTTSIQFTHSTNSSDTTHRWAKVHSALMPLYYSVFENRSREKDGTHEALEMRKNMGDRCLILDYVFRSKDGDDFADKYVDFVANSPVYLVLDENGEDRVLEEPTTFNQLPENEQTLGNFLQAASFQWGVCKIKTIVDETKLAEGKIDLSNILLEVRDFDTADDSVPVISNWMFSLIQNEENLLEIENRLEDMGVPVVTDPEAASEIVKEALFTIGSKDTKFLDTEIGNKGRTVRDMVNKIVIPMAHSNNSTAENITVWKDIAKSQEAPFSKYNKPNDSFKASLIAAIY